MSVIKSTPQPELVQRATELGDLIRKHSAWQEENRVLHQEVIDGLTDAGLLNMRTPARFGGTLPDLRTVVDSIAEIGRADGSTAWTLVTFTIGSWLAGLLPDDAQDVIWADPNVRFCGSIGPNGIAVANPDGGYTLNGKWHFNTGASQSQWDTHAILLATPDGGYVPAMAVVPTKDLTIVDDWHTVGLRATGSMSTIAENLHVPDNFLLPMLPLALEGKHGSVENAKYQAWNVPFVQFAVGVAASPALGMARAAMDNFRDRLPNRGITYTNYERQIEAPLTHLQIGEAAIKIDEAAFHLHRAVDRLDTKSLNGEQWTPEERAVARMDAAAVCARGKEAVDVLNEASGGSSVYSHVPMQRIERDMQTINLHGIMHPNTNKETYGRVLCGLEPNTVFF
jgi:alkylation response protein AidB-like acyl-CoA dehydrogenase